MTSEILEKVKEGALYDYIAANYYKLSDGELKDLLLEYIYAFWQATRQLEEISARRAGELKEELYDNIKELLDYYED